jgi:DNA recombination protein RmuC
MELQFRDAFASLSSEALSTNTERFLTLARETLTTQTSVGAAELDSRRKLIDQSIQQVTQRLEGLRTATSQLEAARSKDYGQLSQAMTHAVRQTDELRQTTENLRAALAHPQRRGQWGERMAADILQLAGMIEGANYTRQTTLEGNGKRPDFTFHLASGVKLNMDVKFPLDNYLRYMEVDGDQSRRDGLAAAFCSDVRTQVRAIATKDYIDPAAGTADFALMFIPNEQMFAFIQELDTELLREASQRRVVMVGPLSLLAVLAIARQAAETANLSRQTGEALDVLAAFNKQWGSFKLEMDKLGQRLDAAVKQYDSLRTTRSNMLDRPLAKLEQLRDGTDTNEQESHS